MPDVEYNEITMRLGYIMFSPGPESNSEDEINALKSAGCEKIFGDPIEREEKRSQWKKMLNEVKRKDEIVILCLSNAVRGLAQLASFFEMCRIKKLRVISLRDKFDSSDIMFTSSISQLIDAIGALPGDILSIKISGARMKAARRKKDTSFQITKEERYQRCVDLYNAGIPLKEIKTEVGFSSSSSVYRILENKGIKVNRRELKK